MTQHERPQDETAADARADEDREAGEPATQDDTESDPALDAGNSEWTAEGGATPLGPATSSPGDE
ncbi:hypothetical protein [Nocardioides allogilvus]|uniref:hypothetical protein n=1 Tax=Nocardioides allogilvus TaxID=2072017 RepID=UPI000D3049A8|nr:hypothetical protein [Nocardioides allogilvus]